MSLFNMEQTRIISMSMDKRGGEKYAQEAFVTHRYILCRTLLSLILM
jgi:hypothetical protein